MQPEPGPRDDDAFARRVRRYARDDADLAPGEPRRYHLSSGYDLPRLRVKVGATAIPAPPPVEHWMDDVAVLAGLAPARSLGEPVPVTEVSAPDHMRWWGMFAGVLMATAAVLRLIAAG
jgi:hypothetical protein